ncbi:TPA: hypothetical protein SLF17_003119 [Serratia marcescens]|nr:hypothetical protein [Serratia marcescens]
MDKNEYALYLSRLKLEGEASRKKQNNMIKKREELKTCRHQLSELIKLSLLHRKKLKIDSICKQVPDRKSLGRINHEIVR